jgi:hypothetical protein
VLAEATLPFSRKCIATVLLVLGLVLTAVGAGIAASGVILTQTQATELANTKWGMNVELRDALLDQSARAKWGLITVAIGTVMQLAGTVIQLMPLKYLRAVGRADPEMPAKAKAEGGDGDRAMADTTGFRIRLRVRIAKGLTTEATSLHFIMANKDVTITSQNKEEPLSKAKWIVLNASGFSTEEAARHFGTRLRSILQLAALSSRLGVDPGEDKPTSWVNEDFARSIGLIKEHERIAPNVHGLAILPDDDNTRFPVMNAQATVTADPEHFLSAS